MKVTMMPAAASGPAEQLTQQRLTLGRMAMVLGVLSEAVAWTDRESRILWCNPSFDRLLGRAHLSLLGKPVDQVMQLMRDGKPLDPQQHPARLAVAGEASRPLIEVYQMERSGVLRTLEIYSSCLRSAHQTSGILVVRDITERRLAEQWLESESARVELLRALAAASNQAEEPEVALEAALRQICRFTGWPVGHVWLVEHGVLASAELWYQANPDRFHVFRRQTESMEGQSLEHALPQLVLAAGRPVWISDFQVYARCPRAAAARQCGIRSAFALPVLVDGGACAVVEFFSTEPQEADRELLQLAEQIGSQLGRVFERKQARQEMLRAQQELERRVAKRTAELEELNATLRSEIDNREQYQVALGEAVERYQTLLHSLRDVVFSIAADGRVQSLNGAFERLTGYNRHRWLFRRALGLIHHEDRAAAVAAFRKVREGQAVEAVELRLATAGGETLYVECNLTAQYEDNRLTNVAGMARDTTERRRVKEELLLRDRAMASTSEGILITDPSQPGNPIVYGNSGFERLTGYSVGEVLGRGLDLLNGEGTGTESIVALEEALRGCHPATVEMRSYRRDGSQFWSRTALTPVRDANGRLTHFVAIQSDISQHKEAEQMKNELVSTVSHELRTPLTSLRGFAELMLEREFPPEKQKRFLGIIHKESTRLSELINDFLDVQRMESGRQEYDFARVALQQLLPDAAALFKAGSPGHTFRVDASAELPHIRADANRLRQVLTNLVSNAVKFSPQGGEVRLSAEHQGNHVCVRVSDQGIGIPPEAMAKLFQKFYRVDNTATRKIGGTGLGLSIVKQIVQDHGGEIGVESAPGRGSEFWFTMPVFTA